MTTLGEPPVLPSISLPSPQVLPRPALDIPTADIPTYKPMVIPPADLEAPPGVKSETKESNTEQPSTPKLDIPFIDMQVPLPTAEVVTTATYAAVAAVATTTLATPFFDQIKKRLQKLLQTKIDKWKKKRESRQKTSLAN